MAEQTPITLEIRKLYVGDLSIEVPHAPEIFNTELNPEISMNVSHEVRDLPEEGFCVVSLKLTITAKNQTDDKTIYLIEATQSGIFEIKGLEKEQLQHARNVYCTTTLYPYVREVVSAAIVRAGFPSLFIQPVNFEALYQSQLQKMAAGGENIAKGGEA